MISSASFSGDVQAITEKVQSSGVFLKPLLQNISKVIVGQREMVDRVLIGLLTGGHILMEGAPDGFDPKHLKRVPMESVPVVEDVHHVHAWSLTPERALLSLHVQIAAGADYDQALNDIQDALATRLDIGHVTIQLEGAWCAESRGAATSLRPSYR